MVAASVTRATIIAMMLCTWVASSEAKVRRTFDVGNWLVAVYADDKSGSFTSCNGHAGYKNGVLFEVIITGDYHWFIKLGRNSWNWPGPQDLTTRARYSFDGAAWSDMDANSIDKYIFLWPAGSFAKKFASGRVLSIQYESQTLEFELAGTKRLVETLLSCVQLEKLALDKSSDERKDSGSSQVEGLNWPASE
jgi:hypothetical protein